MPVRIYDIAKKFGLESKEVLVKAKELGIVHAKVASSTLDKITAEYLEQQIQLILAKEHPEVPAAPAAPAAHSNGPSGPVDIKLVTAPPEPPAPEPEPVVPAPAPEAEPAPQPVELATAEAEPAPTPALPPQAVEAPELPVPVVPTVPQVVESTPAEVAAPVAEAIAPATEMPQAEPVVHAPPAAVPEVSAAPAAAAVPAVVVAAAPAAPVAPPPPPPPPVPAKPGIGDKVGFIKLPSKPGGRVVDKPVPKPPPPVRQEAQRHDRFNRGSGSQPQRGGPQQAQRGGAQPAGRPQGRGPQFVAPPGAVSITMKPPITVRDLAEKLNRKPFQIIADLMEAGTFANVNQAVDEAAATRICAKHGFKFELEKRDRTKQIHAPVKRVVEEDPDERPEDLLPRAPVVTIMGHVDHGKTSLLDVIRKANVAAGEAGGITQHIGAYTISFPHPEDKKRLQQITFLDTPGHAAFSAMRARGANVTDIVVLVVAANDGVMPQTLEALSHAQEAKVPILVAINKCDHPNANPLKVRQQLNDKGLVPDDWGGSTIYVECSALTKQGVDKLLEMILLQADLLELKANPKRKAKGNVIESGLEPGGPTATVLVRKGTLSLGNVIICGQFYGKVRALISEDGKRMKEAGPSVAVKVLGLNGVPEAGHHFAVMENAEEARDEAEKVAMEIKIRNQEVRTTMNVDTLFATLKSANDKILKLVVKADTQGSVEAIYEALNKIESTKVSLEIIHRAVGTITETDVQLASASKAVILGFHTRVDSEAADCAKRDGIQIKLYAIIYELIDEVRDAMAGLLDPLIKESVAGAAEVRKVFSLSKGGNVAGCMVSQGRIVRGKVRVVRRKNVIYEGLISSLRRYQDEANEVRAGMECGIRIDGFNEFQEGDSIESYQMEKIVQKLD